jgi:hypothetical protein
MLFSFTFLVSLAALATGLWLGLYVVTRSPRRWTSWLTGLTLWSLCGHFLNVLLALAPLPAPTGAPAWLNPLLQFWVGQAPGRPNMWLQSWLIIPAIVFWHHATTLMYSPHLDLWRVMRLSVGYGVTIAAAIVQVNTEPLLAAAPGGDPLYLSALKAGPLYPFFLALGLIYIAVALWNLYASARAAPTPILRNQVHVLLVATLLASSVVFLSIVGSIFGLRVPIVATSVPLGAGMALIGYGVARYSALIEGRTIRRDFYHAAASIGLVTGLYLSLIWVVVHNFGVPPMAYVLTVPLAITTHFLVDAARYHRDASLHRRDVRQTQTSLRKLASMAADRDELNQHLSATLGALCASVRATYGLLLLFEDGDLHLAAAQGWHEEDPHLSRQDLTADDVLHLKPGQFPSPLAEAALLIPLYGGGEQLGALILGRPVNGVSYSPDDVDQLLYPSDRLGDVVWTARRTAEYLAQVAQGADVHPPEALRYPVRVAVEDVEDALRHLADYGYLGDHALARLEVVRARLAVTAVTTHLDLGRAVYSLLAEAIEKLRPAAKLSGSPPPREWYPYLILHDAYVEGVSNRDIMSRLYISHGTFSRTRRGALRALARALEEMEGAAEVKD